MVCGDFNCTFYNKIDRIQQRNTEDISVNELNEFVTKNNLCDYSRLINPDVKKNYISKGKFKIKD